MKPQFDLSVLRSAWLFRRPLRKSSTKHRLQAIRDQLMLGMALLFMALSGGKLQAQEGPQPWPTDDDYVNGHDQSNPQYEAPQKQYSQIPYSDSQNAQPHYRQQGFPQQQAYADPSQGFPQEGLQQRAFQQPGFNAERLEQIVAPIALYPDNLVALLLAASTYPAQVAAADQWLRMQGNGTPDQIAAGADAQTNWDPSVKALTAFPQVLEEMARNLQWTTDLGNAYYNQPQDVMQTIQVMRDRAQQAGNLQSTPQEQVTVDQGNIELSPTDPQQVYVPSYNPWSVYGEPVQPYQGFSLLDSLGSIFGSSPIQYGLSFAMSAFMHTPWGWLGWGLDWLSHSVLFNNDSYFSHSHSVRDWGFPHGGPRYSLGRQEMARYRDSNGWGHNGGYPRPRPEFNRGHEQGFGRQNGWYGAGRTGEGYGREYQSYGNTYGRSWQEANNHLPRAIGRPQQFGGGYGALGYGNGSSTYGRSYGNHGSGHYGSQSGQGYSNNPGYRAPTPIYHGGGGGGRDYRGYGGSGIAQRHSSGGFHLFGGGHQSNGFNYGGGHSSRGSSYGGGHSSWGGGFKAPKSSHFGGGGGGHFGGGHSGGGHSGGGHSHHH